MRYSLIYGGIAGTIAVAVIGGTIALDLSSHGTGSVFFGYLVMLVALSLIFVGVKRFRDVECGGVVGFGRAFRLGLGMALVAAAIYAAGWEIYLAASGYDFMAAYAESVASGMRAEGASQAAIDARLAEMRELAVSYRNPLFRIPLTFIEIFPVGLLVSLVSAALLRNPKLLPARA
jgi:hypothetical protein